MRNPRLAQGLLLALLLGWPIAAADAQDAPASEAGDDGATAEGGAAGEVGETAADEAAADDATAVDEPVAAEVEGDTAAVDAGDETDEAAEVDGDALDEAPAGAVTDPGALSDADLLEVDPDMLIDPLPDRPRTGIFGRVVDAGTGEPLYTEVPVVLVEENARKYTTTDGFFTFRISAGTYTLRSFFDRYQNATVPDVTVRPGQATEVVIRLAPDTDGGGDDLTITITAERGTVARRLEERQQAAAVSDGFTAEEIKQSGDSDADQAVRRVVGITTDRDGFLYIRGLGGRYVQTLVDNSPFPSTDPDNPGVRLTLFPTDVLSGLNVYKTFTADYPGSMAGGLLEIETRSFPSRFEVNAGVSLGFNTETTFGRVPTYAGGGLDWLGYDDGTRALPDPLRTRRLPRDASADYPDLARSFPYDFALRSRMAAPNVGVSVDIGDTLLVGERFLGYYAAFAYGYSEQQYTGQQVGSVQLEDADCTLPDENGVRDFSGCRNFRDENYNRNANQVETQLSGIGNLTFELADDQQLHYTTIYTNRSEDYTSFQSGLNTRENEFIDTQRFRFTQEQAWWNQLRGEHDDIIGSGDLDWRINFALANRRQPDLRELGYRREDQDAPPAFQGRNPGEGQRLYTDLEQVELGAAVDYTTPFDVFLGEGTFKLGAFVNGFDRAFDFRRFQFRLQSQTDPDRFLPPGELFVADRVADPNRSPELLELTRAVDSYDATQRNYAAYAHLDTELFANWLRLVAGVRGEVFRQTLETNTEFAAENPEDRPAPQENIRTDVDVLPSVNLVARVYEAGEGAAIPGTMQVRAGYSQTVARPLIRELAPFVFPDFERNGTVAGNPDLVRTRVQSVDLRWEWFISATEVLAVSGFLKIFEDPIEKVVIGGNNQFGYQNINEADNLGLEIEGRLDFKRFADELAGLTLGANLTLVRSQVRFERADQPLATNLDRPMAGQSPYVVNVSLGWDPDPDDSPFSFALFYNVFGRRITEVGSVGLQDIYQQPFHSMNLTAKWAVDDAVTLKLTMKNIGDIPLLIGTAIADGEGRGQVQEFLQDGIVVYSYEPGMTATVGLDVSFD